MKDRPLPEKLRFAAAGIVAAWRRESNFRRELAIAAAVLAALAAIRPALLWWALAVLAIGLVLAAEILNAAIEALADRLMPEHDAEIRVVKDMLAGVVLLVSAAAGAVGLLLVLSVL